MPCSFAAGTLITVSILQACIGSLVSRDGGVMSGPLALDAPAANTVRHGSLVVGDTDFRRSLFATSGPHVAVFSRVGSQPTDQDGIYSFYSVTHAGGNGNVITNLHVATQVDSTPRNGIWGFLSTLASKAAGGNGGLTGHVAGYLQTVRTGVPIAHATVLDGSRADALRVDDVALFNDAYDQGAGVAVSPSHPLPVSVGGGRAEVIGVTPEQGGATRGPGTLALRSPVPAGERKPGDAVRADVAGANLWGGVIEYKELVDLPSSRAGMGQTLELDWSGNNADDRNGRTFISAVLGKYAAAGADVEIGNVIGVWPGANMTRTSGGSIKRGLWVGVPFSEAVLDTRTATQRGGANAIWLGDGHRLAMDSSGQRYWSADAGVLAYHAHGAAAFSIDESGAARLGGALSVGTEQVVGPRAHGWSAPEGAVSRGPLSAAWAGQVSDTCRPDEVRAIAAQTSALSAHLGALILDLSRHGMIGP